VTTLRRRLGIPLAFVKKNMKCSCKKKTIIDPFGDHFHACPIGNLRQARHNMLTAEIKHMLAYAGISSKIELSLGLEDKYIRPDLVAHHPSFGDLKIFYHHTISKLISLELINGIALFFVDIFLSISEIVPQLFGSFWQNNRRSLPRVTRIARSRL